MGDLDDRLRRELGRASRPVGTEGLLDRIGRRHRSRQLRTKIGVSVLSFALAGSAITGVFLARGEPDPTAGGGGGGVIVFTRTLRECSPNVVPTQQPQLFAVTPDGSTEWNLSRALDLPGGARYPLNLRGSYVHEIAFAPDGSRAAWWAPTGRGSPSGITILDLAGGTQQHQVGTGDRITAIGDLAFSPDGRTIAFTAIEISEEQASSVSGFDMAIWTVPTDGSAQPMRLTRSGQLPLPSYQDSLPIWSPDGGTIAFLRTHYSGTGARPQQALMFVDADGSNHREIERQPTDANFTVLSGDWSPDGTRFVAEVTFDSFPPTDLFIANIDGRTGYRLTDAHWANDGPGSWSPDGTLIAFQTGRWGRGQGHAEIAITDPSGEHVRRVTDNCWDDQSPVWVDDAAYIRSLPPWRSEITRSEELPVDQSPAPIGEAQLLQGVPFPVCRPMTIPGDFGEGLDTLWVFEEERVAGAGCGDNTEGFQHVGVGTAHEVVAMTGRDIEGSTGRWPFATPDIDADGIDEIAIAIDGTATRGRASVVLFRVDAEAGVPVLAPVALDCGPACDPVPWIDLGSAPEDPPAGAYCGDFSEHPELGVGLMRWAVDGDRVRGVLWVFQGSTLSSAIEDITLGGPASTATALSDGTMEFCGDPTHWPEDFPNYRTTKLSP